MTPILKKSEIEGGRLPQSTKTTKFFQPGGPSYMDPFLHHFALSCTNAMRQSKTS